MSKIDTKGTLAGILVANSIGEAMLLVIPLILGNIVEAFNIREGTAGIILSFELGSVAITSLVISSLIYRVDARRVIYIAIVTFLFGNLISFLTAMTNYLSLFIISRGITGFGEGALFAMANIAAAGTDKPDRTYSFMEICLILTAFLAFIVITIFVGLIGPIGAFAAAGVIGFIGLPFLRLFPSRCGHTYGNCSGNITLVRFDGMSFFLLLAGGLWCTGFNGLWSYVERIGLSLNVPYEKISLLLIGCALLNIIGPIINGLLGVRYGRTFPIIVGLTIQILAALSLVYNCTFLMYAGSVFIIGIAACFTVPNLRGLMAFLDPSGRVNGVSTAFFATGAAAGPFIAGLILNLGGGYKGIAWITVFFVVLSTALIFRPALHSDRKVPTLS